MTTFADLGVRQALIDVLQARGISEPFPIQTQTLPDTLAGRDVALYVAAELARGAAGSGWMTTGAWISAALVVPTALCLGITFPLAIGVAAHEGSTVVVCLNSLRLLFGKNQ